MNRYAEVIDMIANDTINYKKVVIEIAKSHPGLICKCVGKTISIDKRDEIFKKLNCHQLSEIKTATKDGQIISAVKATRAYVGCSLVEAKNFVDSLK